MTEEKKKPRHRMPLDVRFVAGLCILDTIGSVMSSYRLHSIARGGFLLGVIHTDATWIVALYHVGLAAYMALTAKGLWGMHRYGFWMLVASVWLGIVLAPFHLYAQQDAIPDGSRTLWVTVFGIAHACKVALAIWCFWRHRLFTARNEQESHSTRGIGGHET